MATLIFFSFGSTIAEERRRSKVVYFLFTNDRQSEGANKSFTKTGTQAVLVVLLHFHKVSGTVWMEVLDAMSMSFLISVLQTKAFLRLKTYDIIR